MTIDPSRCWMYCALNAATDAYDQALAEEEQGTRAPSARGVERPSARDLPMGSLYMSPHALIGTATEARQIIIQVCVGAEHGILLTDAGICFTWGDNRHGQIGRQPCLKEENKTPFPVLGLLGHEVTQVAAGLHHCMALCAPGLVWAWGRNKAGQLGCGSYRDKVAPERVCHAGKGGKAGQDEGGMQLGADDPIIAISAGGSSSVASSLGSQIWQWGEISDKFIETPTAGAGGKSAKTVPRNRPWSVFKREKFLTLNSFRKALPKGAGPVAKISIMDTGCRVMGKECWGKDMPDEEAVLDMNESIRQLQEAIAKARTDLAEHMEKKQREQTTAKAGDTELVQDLQISIGMLEREVVTADQDRVMLEKSLQSIEVRQEHTREQLNVVMQQSTQLNQRQDELSLKMFEMKKGTAERKKLQEKLAEIRKYIDANMNTREILLEQKSETDKEKQRIQFALYDKRQSQDKLRHKLKTLQDLSSAVESAFGASDSTITFLKERKNDFHQHFTGRTPESEFVEAMKEFEYDKNFLRGIEARIKDLPGTASSDQARALRSQIVCDLLQDLVSLRRSWSDLLEDRWLKDDLDLSCFFAPVADKQAALTNGR
mmetsp:Transcript_10810/g.28760  ORF Transcript_10810/g.28760 Transcript_10810/m.28760 type:complete len:602 (+) Transcript_10810:36-1841(+)